MQWYGYAENSHYAVLVDDKSNTDKGSFVMAKAIDRVLPITLPVPAPKHRNRMVV